jgi:hypothetical protein
MNAYRIMAGKLEGKNQQKDLGIGVRKILKWILDRVRWYGLD